MEAWFEDLAAGPVTSLSFSVQTCPHSEEKYGAPGLQFWVPEFLVGTSDAFIVGVDSQVFEELRPEDRRGVLLVQGMADDVEYMATHPSRSLLALVCRNGALQVWDYSMKLLMNLREFITAGANPPPGQLRSRAADVKAKPMCLAYDPSDEFLVLGFSSGLLRFVNVDTLVDVISFNIGTESITHVKFSANGLYLAAYDAGGHLMIYKRPHGSKSHQHRQSAAAEESKHDATAATARNDIYLYLGRIIPHKGVLAGFEFCKRESIDILVSVGTDRRCIEYNLSASSVEAGIVIADAPVVIELTAKPTAFLWHPHIGNDVEDRLIYSTDDFKFKNINADSKLCRKTTLAPSFGGCINSLIAIPSTDPEIAGRYYAFSTAERVVGLGCLPLTGDPNEVSSINENRFFKYLKYALLNLNILKMS